MGQAFPSRWLSGSSCVTAWCVVLLLSLKLRSSIQHSDAQSFLSAGMSPSGWPAQYMKQLLTGSLVELAVPPLQYYNHC